MRIRLTPHLHPVMKSVSQCLAAVNEEDWLISYGKLPKQGFLSAVRCMHEATGLILSLWVTACVSVCVAGIQAIKFYDLKETIVPSIWFLLSVVTLGWGPQVLLALKPKSNFSRAQRFQKALFWLLRIEGSRDQLRAKLQEAIERYETLWDSISPLLSVVCVGGVMGALTNDRFFWAMVQWKFGAMFQISQFATISFVLLLTLGMGAMLYVRAPLCWLKYLLEELEAMKN